LLQKLLKVTNTQLNLPVVILEIESKPQGIPH